MSGAPGSPAHPIAIIGIGCRFPRACGPEAFWRLLADGVDAITEIPASRFDIDAYYDPAPGAPGKISSRWGGFIEGIERFDAAFFGIAPREAEIMDPQHRVLLETAYEALEDAGISPAAHGLTNTGVFLGMMSADYLQHLYCSAPDLDLSMAAGTSRGTAAARISQLFGFEGPSIVIDSDRASSLAALHLACASLRSKECGLALAGASNAILRPELSIACSRSRMLSSDGRCKFCDARADGICRSDGFGALVLKRLDDAMRDGDRIYAVVRGSAVTNNGSSSVDMMRPSARAQEALLRAALSDAACQPADILYVEAHGTGTRAGDQAETEALGAVLGQGRPPDQPCLIGSVKTNIGHAEGAAGMAGVIKVALALHHGAIPKSLHFEHPNPELKLEECGLRVQAAMGRWPTRGESPARAGISAFGLTGTLAHVILEARRKPRAANQGAAVAAASAFLLPLSARSSEALDALAEKYSDWLSEAPSESLASVCYSASVRRQHHPYRLSVTGSSMAELKARLDDYREGREPFAGASGHVAAGERPKLAFVFPGQGGQWAGMGRELLHSEPVFCDAIAACETAIRNEAGWSLTALLRGEMDAALLEDIEYVQPALTAVMVALAALWRAWGVEPAAVLGFSMGEAAAAQAAGILSIEEAIAVVCRRTRLMNRLRGQGALASIGLSLSDAEQVLRPYGPAISVAVVAAPETTVLAGDPAALARLLEQLEGRGVFCRRIKADVASHCGQVETLLDELRSSLARLQPRAGSIPLVSTVDDALLTGPELTAAYWARNLRQPVLQMNGIAKLIGAGFTAFLEVSPHPIAWNPLLETIRHLGANARAAASLRRDEGEREALLKGLGALHANGVSPNWNALFRPEDRRFVSLPGYAWQEQSYWLQPGVEAGSAAARSATAPPAVPAPAPQAPAKSSAGALLAEELRNAPAASRPGILTAYLQDAVARMLKLAGPSSAPAAAPLRELGLTSLMATELALQLGRSLGQSLPSTLLFNYPTIESLAARLSSEQFSEAPVPAPAPAAEREPMDAFPGPEPIAIVGMACRLPGGVMNPDDYWRLLRGGVDAISEVPADRWDKDRFYDPDPDAAGKMYTRWGGFLDSIDRFDAAYFGISPREAELLDPQQRLLLEVTVEALENAGYAPDPQQARNAGVFVGIMNTNEFVSYKGISSDPSLVDAHDSTGQATSAAAGRLSYALGFQGPSMAVDTACSSSLVAIHLACQALRAGECRMAVAGGVNILLAPEVTISFCKTRMLSPTGRCQTFDAHADGYVRGEGCGVIVLKPLSAARRDHDNILALIRGSAVNQDGRSSSLTAPNGLAQQAVVRQALEMSGLRPREIDYVEAHGTGTALGDPIELEALGAVLGEDRDREHPFIVSSVKTNIGHLESAAGVAGLIKTVLALQNREIPPHLHLREVNPRISLEQIKAKIPLAVLPWPQTSKPRAAGISSFGFVGTNAHLIVEEAPADANTAQRERQRPAYRLLALSARTPESLRELATRYSRLLGRQAVDVDDACFTANTGRLHHSARAAFVGTDTESLRARLQAFMSDPQSAARTPQSASPKIAFLFTGQGAQYSGMGRQLWETEPVYRAALERCAAIMDPLLATPLLSLLHGDDPSVLEQTRFAQPALLALEYALLEQWGAWGVEPSMVMGHSLGEYSAALAAGVLSLEDAARLVVTRGKLMHSIQTPGGAAAVFASESFVRPFVEPYLDTVSLAADNAPERVLVTGAATPLQAICAELEAKGIEVRRMIGLTAAHSPLMDPILDLYETVGAMATYRAPSIPVVSSRTGRLTNYAEIGSPRHWRNLIREKVRFREGMQALYEAGCRIFVEIGPRHTLVRLGEMCVPAEGSAWLSSLSKEKHDQQQMLEALGELYARGLRVRWEERHRPFAGRRIPLPTTPFDRKSFWPRSAADRSNVSARSSRARKAAPTSGPDALLGRRVLSPLDAVQFEAEVEVASLPLLEDHRIFGALVMPAAAHIIRALLAAAQVTGREQWELREAVFPQPLILRDSGDCRLATLVLTSDDGQYSFQIASTNAETTGNARWMRHAAGRMRALEHGPNSAAETHHAFTQPAGEPLAADEFYAAQARRGYAISGALRWLDRIWLSEEEGWAVLRMPSSLGNGVWHGLHPGLIDSCFQIASCLRAKPQHEAEMPHPDSEAILVPAAVEGVRTFRGGLLSSGAALYCRVASVSGPAAAGDQNAAIEVFDESGAPILSIAKLHMRRVTKSDFLGRTAPPFETVFRHLQWREVPWPDAASPMAGRPGRWLLFANEGDIAGALDRALRNHGQSTVMVHPAADFEQRADAFRLNPDRPSDAGHLLTAMRDLPGPPWRGIVYLWGLHAGSEPDGRDTQACAGLLHLMKAMAVQAGRDPAPLWIITRNAQSTGKENHPANPGQAMLWGLGRVFASEHCAPLGGIVDLDPHGAAEEATELCEQLLAAASENQVAHRRGRLLAPRLVPVEQLSRRGSFQARPDAAYLVTGAFGALGRKVTEWLCDAGARHLALLSRKEPDAERSRRFEELTSRGIQIRAFETDVSNYASLARTLTEIDRTMPTLRGVIHAAGIIEDNVLLNLEWGSFERVLAPKRHGAWNLHLLTQERPLDFWVLFSSVSALLGNPGQGAYAAGNAFGDAVAHMRRAQGAPALSINWGPWRGDGMSASAAADLQRRWGLLAIDPADGVYMLAQLLGSPGAEAQIWAATLDADILRTRGTESGHLSLVSELVGGSEQPAAMADRNAPPRDTASRLRNLPSKERASAVLEHVVEVVRSVTAMGPAETLRVDGRFDELGVDSLLSLDLIEALNRSLAVNMPPTITIDYPTIELLARHLADELEPAVTQASAAG